MVAPTSGSTNGPRARLQRAREELVEARVARRIGIRGLAHVDAVLVDEPADQLGRAHTPAARCPPTGIDRQRLILTYRNCGHWTGHQNENFFFFVDISLVIKLIVTQ